MIRRRTDGTRGEDPAATRIERGRERVPARGDSTSTEQLNDSRDSSKQNHAVVDAVVVTATAQIFLLCMSFSFDLTVAPPLTFLRKRAAMFGRPKDVHHRADARQPGRRRRVRSPRAR